MKQPNIIMIMTDQQRFDTIQALGASHMITPNMDRLVREGTSFTNAFVTAPSCVPSRASLFNGKFPSQLHVQTNFSRWEHSWVELLQEDGYHTVNIGKMHTIPFDTPCGFDNRVIVENKDRPLRLEQAPSTIGGFYDEWNRFMRHSGVRQPSSHTYREEYPDYDHALGAFEWPLEEQYHPDVFVGRAAKWFIEERQSKKPLFLQIGFPGPHPPFDPPQRYIDMYEGADIPCPSVTEAELTNQHPFQTAYRDMMIRREGDAVKWKRNPTMEQLKRMRPYYAANVTLIDDQVGLIMDALQQKGYLDDAIVIFMSDHGEALGDHGQIQKWTMYDCVTRVPMIVWSPGRIPAGERREQLIQHMDIPATLLELLNMDIPEDWQAKSLGPELEAGRKYVFCESREVRLSKNVCFVSMIRSESFKLVHYLEESDGELYDLRSDPDETNNLWHDERYGDVRQELFNELVNWRFKQAIAIESR